MLVDYTDVCSTLVIPTYSCSECYQFTAAVYEKPKICNFIIALTCSSTVMNVKYNSKYQAHEQNKININTILYFK